MRVNSRKTFKKLLHTHEKKFLRNTLSTYDFFEKTKDALKKTFFNTRILRKKIISNYKILSQILSVAIRIIQLQLLFYSRKFKKNSSSTKKVLFYLEKVNKY